MLIAAHGNSLRAWSNTSTDERRRRRRPQHPDRHPARYDLDSNLQPKVPGGTYLDPEAAAAGAAAVASQGAK